MNGKQSLISPRVIVQLVVFIGVVPMLPLLISQQWGWWEAWVYAVIYILGFVISRVLAARRHADLLAERARFLQHEDAKSWDKFLAPLVGLGGGSIPLVAGLESCRSKSALWFVAKARSGETKPYMGKCSTLGVVNFSRT